MVQRLGMLSALPNTRLQFKNPHSMAHNYLSVRLQRIKRPLLASDGTHMHMSIHTAIHTNTDTKIKQYILFYI